MLLCGAGLPNGSLRAVRGVEALQREVEVLDRFLEGIAYRHRLDEGAAYRRVRIVLDRRVGDVEAGAAQDGLDGVGRLRGAGRQRLDSVELLVLEVLERQRDLREQPVGAVRDRFVRRRIGKLRRLLRRDAHDGVDGPAGVGAASVRQRLLVGQGNGARRLHAALLGAAEQRVELAVALGKGELLPHQLLDLAFDDLLVEQLAAGDAVDLGAKGGDAVLVVVLHAGLARHGRADQVVAQHEIGGGGEVADREHAGKAERDRRHPGADGHVTNLVAARQDHDMLLRAFSEDAVFRTLRH